MRRKSDIVVMRRRIKIRPGEGVGLAKALKGKLSAVSSMGLVLDEGGTFDVQITISDAAELERDPLRWN